MLKTKSYYALYLLLSIFLCGNAYAIIEPTPTAVDSRIRVMVYNPYDVFKYTGYYGYQASIELARDEEVISISMGDTTAWQIVPAGFRIFIKPMESQATTNMTLVSNKRTYFFELHAEEAQDINDPDMVFNVKFLYPDSKDENSIKSYNAGVSGPDLSHPEKYNFNYAISGNEEIAPIKIFDDGEFTYLQFHDKNAEMPAIFAVDEDLREAMVNSRVSPNTPGLIIVEQVFRKLSARLGKKVVCIFNEAFKSE
ncbi:MAG: P-type conjugative transfer protein VirB9 [Pseudomonadota bacterium]